MMRMLNRKLAAGLTALAVIFSVSTAAQAQEAYRPLNERVVCSADADFANIYDTVDGEVQDRLDNATTVQINHFAYGIDAVPYFSVSYGTDAGNEQRTGFIATAEVKHFCQFRERRRVMLEQYRAPPNTCHLIGASRATLEEVNAFRDEYMAFFPSMAVFVSNTGWFAISLGIIRVDAFDAIMQSRNDIPADAYCSDGVNYIGVLERREDSFQQIEFPHYDTLAARFAAAREMRLAAIDTDDAPMLKRACDIGDWIACGRYNSAIRDRENETPADKAYRYHYALLGCMRGSYVACNNASGVMRQRGVAHTLTPTPSDLVSDTGAPMLPSIDLSRAGCDGEVWTACYFLGTTVWDDGPFVLANFGMALDAMRTVCLETKGTRDGFYYCQESNELLRSKRYRPGLEFQPYDHYVMAQFFADSCDDYPVTNEGSCSNAYENYGQFLGADTGTLEMQHTALDFLVYGCEMGHQNACYDFRSDVKALPEIIVASRDIIRIGWTMMICNPESSFTNMRSAPTAQGSYIKGRLPNDLPVTVTDNIINDAGYLYYQITLSGTRAGLVNERTGFVYHDAVSNSCDQTAAPTQAIQDLSLQLAAVNPELSELDVYALNANFDGTNLLLTGLPGLQDISPLQALNDLTFLDLSEANVQDLSPLANLTALETLSIFETPVSDVSDLVGLTGLRTLNLRRTQVTDLSLLANLTDLSLLYLPRSRADDLTPIQGLIDAGLQVD